MTKHSTKKLSSEGAACSLSGPHICKLCGCEWMLNSTSSPYCPGCGSTGWIDGVVTSVDDAVTVTPVAVDGRGNSIYSHFCNQCGHRWDSVIKFPRLCRLCRNSSWNKPKRLYEPRTCLQCGHRWQARKGSVTLCCYKCKSGRWNMPKEVDDNAVSGM